MNAGSNRFRGFRRRCVGPSLVRSRPSFRTVTAEATEIAGAIWRTMKPTFIADYEGISTASWASGTNVRNYAFTGTSGQSVIMDPIRWVVYEPTTAGDRYDYVTRQSAPRASYLDLPMTDLVFAPNPHGRHAMLNTILPVSGRSHMTLKPTSQLSASFINSPIRISGVSATPSVYKFRHRINGTAVGSLESGPVSVFTGPEWGVALSEGDVYELDVWTKYQLGANGTSTLQIETGQNIGGISDNYSPLAAVRKLTMDSLISYGWNPATHKYNLSFTGGDLTTVDYELFYDTRAAWGYNGTTAYWTISLDWLGEIPLLQIGNVTHGICWFVPADSSDYILSTTRPDMTGTQLWKMGCWDWDGTTTFVPLHRYAKLESFIGKRSGTFEYTDIPMPTAVTVTYAPV